VVKFKSSQQESDLVENAQTKARANKLLAPFIFFGIFVIGCGTFTSNLDNIISFYEKYFGKKSVQRESGGVLSTSGDSLPLADQITALGKRALWSNEYLGSREAYSQLLDWKNSIKDRMTGRLVSAEIKRVEDDYRTDIMRGHIDWWPLICVPHVNCSQGFVKPVGYQAGNVLAHFGQNRRVDERARAACILRNIGMSPDKESLDKNELFEKLISHMGSQEESLCVSKMALETYKDLTGFSSDGVFDFEGAVKDWETRKEEILNIAF